jgi:RNA recognition motif-containing protein
MNGNKLYVGGLPYSMSDRQLEELFAGYGTVESSRVITDRMTGRSRGFGFVEMSTPEEAKAAAEALNGSQQEGRALTVNEAQERSPRPGGGGGGRGGDRGGDRGPSRGGFGGGRGNKRW